MFKLADGPRLLIREVLEEHADAPARPRPERSVDAIRRRAAAENVLEPFDRFIAMSEKAGLFVRPFAEFFDVSEHEAAEALDPGNVDEFLTGAALDARIEQIRKFLIEKLPPPGDLNR